MARKGWTWLKIFGMAGHGWIWLEMAGMAGNGGKLLEIPKRAKRLFVKVARNKLL